MSDRRRIVALGGGGFSMETSRALDDHVLALSGKERPRVVFIPTASGDSDEYVVRFFSAFPPSRCVATFLPLFDRPVDLRAAVLSQDVVYVGGGNTANLLAIWRAHGLDPILREAWAAGVVLAGVSAGALCWFAAGVTDSYGDLQPLTDGLGLLPGSFCPHYDGEPGRRPTFERLVAGGAVPPGYAAEDGVALVFAGTSLAEVVSSRPDGRAFAVEADGPVGVSRPLPVRVLS